MTLTVLVTSGAMASMRDHQTGAQRVVICTGMITQVILVGPDGEELAPTPICPDCTLVLAAQSPQPFVLPRPVSFVPAQTTAPKALREVGPIAAQHPARAPPALAL